SAEGRIARQYERRIVARGAKIFSMQLRSRNSEAGQPALTCSQQVAFAAQSQILFRDSKAVFRFAQNGEARLRHFSEWHLVKKQTGRRARSAADAAAQLVKLGKPKAFRVLDDHDRGFGHVNTDLDDRRCNKQPGLADGKAGHRRVFVRTFHAPVNKIDLVTKFLAQGVKARLGGGEVGLFRFFNQGADPIGAFAFRNYASDSVLNLAKARHGDGPRIDRLPARGFFTQFGNVHVTEKGQDECPRNRRRSQNEHVHRFALLGQRQPLVHAKTMLFIDHGEREVMEGHVFLKKGVSAYQEVDIAKHKTVQDLLAGSSAFASSQNGHA